jgi:hypothetical protein
MVTRSGLSYPDLSATSGPREGFFDQTSTRARSPSQADDPATS